jgi:hypothetical protein
MPRVRNRRLSRDASYGLGYSRLASDQTTEKLGASLTLQGSVVLVELGDLSEEAVAQLIPSLFSLSSVPTQQRARKRPHFQEERWKEGVTEGE